MQNTKTPFTETGCYFDSHRGHYIVPAVIEFAKLHGFILDQFAEFVVFNYDELNDREDFPHEALIDLSDEAISWLNEPDVRMYGQNFPPAKPEGYWWGWNDGDFGLYAEEDED